MGYPNNVSRKMQNYIHVAQVTIPAQNYTYEMTVREILKREDFVTFQEWKSYRDACDTLTETLFCMSEQKTGTDEYYKIRHQALNELQIIIALIWYAGCFNESKCFSIKPKSKKPYIEFLLKNLYKYQMSDNFAIEKSAKQKNTTRKYIEYVISCIFCNKTDILTQSI